MPDLKLPPVDYAVRRRDVCAKLNGSCLLVMAQPQTYRNSTVEGIYRQDAWFYYLTGFSETDSALLLRPTANQQGYESILFLRDKDPVAELWNGTRLGVNEAPGHLKVDVAYGWEQLWSKLPELIHNSKGLYFGLGLHADNDRRVIECLRKARTIGARSNAGILSIFDPQTISGELRVIKRPEEIARMEAAAGITETAFKKVLLSLRPGMNERDVHAMLLSEFMLGGAEMEAYGSIVASGSAACCLHYRDNNKPLKDGDLLLIDAGCQVDNYASDVTRTYPVNGKFTKEQLELYNIVLRSQLDAIEACKPGVSWQDVQNRAFRTIAEGLIHIGLIQTDLEDALAKNLHKKFCPHSISHWIGLDVHDAGVYSVEGKPVGFRPGMYFSVEPGIYIDPKDATVPEGYRGIGIRIEDDVLITEDSCRVLTGSIPKEVAAVCR